MTLEEAQKVAAIAASADGYCSGCACDLMNRLAAAFPEFTWSLRDNWYGQPWPPTDGIRVEPAGGTPP